MDEAPDVIVKWRDGSENCVSTKELVSVKKGENNLNYVGAKIKMLYKRKWYYGTVAMIEVNNQYHQLMEQSQRKSQSTNTEFSSDDDEPLSTLKKNQIETASDKDDPFQVAGDEDPDDQTKTVSNKDDPFQVDGDEDPDDQDFVLTSKRPKKSSMSSDATVCADDMYDEKDISCEQHLRREASSSSIVIDKNYADVTQMEFAEDVGINNSQIDLEIPEISSETHPEQTCEVVGCYKEVFSTCFKCEILECWDHFVNDDVSCDLHIRRVVQSPDINGSCIGLPQTLVPEGYEMEDDPIITSERCTDLLQMLAPESYEMEGDPREVEMIPTKRINKKKQNKLQKDQGKEYHTQVKKTKMPEKKLGLSCNVSFCQKLKRDCYKFNEETRLSVFYDYWAQGDLQRQREFITRHVEKTATERKTVGAKSRRQWTFKYHLTIDGVKVNVCRFFFLNTLSITERVLRTAIKKVTETGIVDKDRRGGRSQNQREIDASSRELCEKHIDRFPRVESHYCSEDTAREYLHSDLTKKKMYNMFINSLEENSLKPSIATYKRVFKNKNLSFHRPKKDQCSLCMMYYNGNEEVKVKLHKKFQKHQIDKLTFRATRKTCVTEAKENPGTVQCVTFDLQQVIHLPITNENAVFYKRRLSTFNFTIYDLVTRDCCCFTWHEAQSKRGASEISTALNIFLKESDKKGFKRIHLFADGCGGQNRNSIVATALMYILANSANIEEITLRFSIPNHGQSAGDSAHSAINYALKQSGNVFLPAQLIPIIRLARMEKPYQVIPLSHKDFLDFKKLSLDLRLLSLRKDDTGTKVNWTEMTEYFVQKCNITKFYFKTSHDQSYYRSLDLSRQTMSFLHSEISPLNENPPKIPKEKYEDLMSLTRGDTPVIRLPEYVEFYRSLPHSFTLIIRIGSYVI